MIDLNRFLNAFRNLRPLYQALYRMPEFNPHEKDGKIALASDPSAPHKPLMFRRVPDGVPLNQWKWFVEEIAPTESGILESWIFAGIAGQGVKVFCPTLKECRALIEIDVNIRWVDYRQPFDTFGIILPPGLFDGPISKEVGVPYATFSRLDTKARFCSCVTMSSSGGHLNGRGVWRADSQDTIEQEWIRTRSKSTDGITEHEIEVEESIQRMLINACLMLVQHGCLHKGKADAAAVETAKAKLSKKNLPETVRFHNEGFVALAPDIYGFDQHIRLFDTEGEPGEATGTGHPVKPHWRRGHWTNQAYGPGMSLRKLQFRKPVLVNSHRFAGDLADTRVSMSVARPIETVVEAQA